MIKKTQITTYKVLTYSIAELKKLLGLTDRDGAISGITFYPSSIPPSATITIRQMEEYDCEVNLG